MIRVCAIVPLYNEEQYAFMTINSLLSLSIIDRIIAVDDGSGDDTWNVINRIEGIDRVRHATNKGKAEAIRSGIEHCSAEIYAFIDGDLGESVQNIKPLIDEVINGKCDVCIARLPESKGTGGIGFLRAVSRLMVKLATKVDFPCPLSGQRIIRRYVITDRRVCLHKGYGIELGMLIDILKCNYIINVIDVNLKHRITVRDFNGYTHRIKQFIDIICVFIYELLRW